MLIYFTQGYIQHITNGKLQTEFDAYEFVLFKIKDKFVLESDRERRWNGVGGKNPKQTPTEHGAQRGALSHDPETTTEPESRVDWTAVTRCP